MSHNTNETNGINPETTGEVAAPSPGSTSQQSESSQVKSVSPRRIAANRANAQHSTGPKTPAGKEKSKQNSRKHGFFARQPLPSGEEGDKLWEEYRDLVAGIWEYYQPSGYMEELLTEKIAAESIRYSRFLSFESTSIGEKRAFHWDGVDRILRFQSAINRQLFQAMHELEHLQEKRKANPNQSNRSAREPGDGEVGRAGFDVQNDGPPSGSTHVEAPGNEMIEVVAAAEASGPHSSSQGRPVATGSQPATGDRGLTS